METLGNHDQIPQLLAYFEEHQQFYLVQELIQGNSLSQELIPGTQLSETQVIQLLQNILHVLAFVHQENVIHRDIKPDNLMRRQTDGKIALIDFGAVKEIGNLSAQPASASFTVAIGTRGYMPNEQAGGKPQLNSDVYAVGIIAIQALTGLNPDPQAGGFPQDPTTGEISWRHLAPVRDKLATIIDKKMVLQDYRQRYADAGAALQDILALSAPPVPPTAISLPASSGTHSTVKPNQSILMGILHWPRDHKIGFTALIVATVNYMTTGKNGLELKHQAIWTVKDGKVYQITYSDEISNFSNNQPVMKKVQESFV